MFLFDVFDIFIDVYNSSFESSIADIPDKDHTARRSDLQGLTLRTLFYTTPGKVSLATMILSTCWQSKLISFNQNRNN